MLYDAHNHLQDSWLAPHLTDCVAVLERLGLGAAVVNGTHPDDWAAVGALAQAHAWVRPSYGLHPWYTGRRPADWQARLESALVGDARAAVGEIGLDRWVLEDARRDDPRLAAAAPAPFDEQLSIFHWQLALAARLNRPITIHCLRAWGPLLEVLAASPRPERGFLVHAYGGSTEVAQQLAALGAYFSFSPAFLDPRKTRQREVFAALPAERLLVETDAPAMSPPPGRTAYALPPALGGAPVNHPGNLVVAYDELAALRRRPEADLRTQVANNFQRLFG